MNKHIYVDINVIQTVPSSNINRDDTGSPKTCIFGGVTRSRISSQAQKRAVRLEFNNLLPEEENGIRTKKIVGLLAQKIKEVQPSLTDAEAEKEATDALTRAGLKIKNAAVGTDALMLISEKQLEALAKLKAAGESDSKAYKQALSENPSVDMALFGRMVASKPMLNMDAACQVAHAVSTHEVENEYDYFTAVDDLAPEDNAGAAHIGTTEFNSSTLYRYATVNVLELYKSLGKETPEALRAFVQAFITTMPSGKQNSFANRTIPSSVYIVVRDDQPVSLAPAFEKPVRTSGGYEEGSQKRLVEYVRKTESFVDEPYVAFIVGSGLEELGKSLDLKDALNQLETTVADLLKSEDC